MQYPLSICLSKPIFLYMSGSKKKKTPAEELIESLLKDMGVHSPNAEDEVNERSPTSTDIEGLVLKGDEQGFVMTSENTEYDDATKSEFEGTRPVSSTEVLEFSTDEEVNNNLAAAMGALTAESTDEKKNSPRDSTIALDSDAPAISIEESVKDENIKTEVINEMSSNLIQAPVTSGGDSDKTVAVAGYQMRSDSDYSDKVKISVGQNRMSSGYQAWNNSGSAESNLGQAENLRIAQEKIIELEQENEKLRLQNEELMAASEIIKERSDLLSAQINEYKNDRDGLEDSFKNEIVLLKNHLARKDTELQRVQFKTEELDSRLKFDMKKIRIRERELENRLELIRAEKNAVVKNKDEQILDLKRKMDVLQMEVESYRQKCVDLNKSIESSQDSFKRTTRALRLAMANLELQEENKVPLKKVD